MSEHLERHLVVRYNVQNLTLNEAQDAKAANQRRHQAAVRSADRDGKFYQAGSRNQATACHHPARQISLQQIDNGQGLEQAEALHHVLQRVVK